MQLTKLHTYRSYDMHDCASTGYHVDLRSDGSLRITTRSCWQGSRSGRVVLTAPGTISLPLPVGDDAPDADAILAEWMLDRDIESAGRVIRVGYVVR
jgi:hypothetical protein